MFGRPKEMVAASGLAILGAIVSLVAAVLAVGADFEPMEKVMALGLMLLLVVMFFAISGSLAWGSKQTWRSALIFIFLTGAVVIVAVIYGKAVYDVISVIQIIIVLAVGLLVSGQRSADWMLMNGPNVRRSGSIARRSSK